jgi:hypothetical protein
LGNRENAETLAVLRAHPTTLKIPKPRILFMVVTGLKFESQHPKHRPGGRRRPSCKRTYHPVSARAGENRDDSRNVNGTSSAEKAHQASLTQRARFARKSATEGKLIKVEREAGFQPPMWSRFPTG